VFAVQTFVQYGQQTGHGVDQNQMVGGRLLDLKDRPYEGLPRPGQPHDMVDVVWLLVGIVIVSKTTAVRFALDPVP
jgi:hypothetical protein